MEFGTSLAAPWLADIPALIKASKSFDEAGLDYVTVAGHVLSAASGRYSDRPETTYGVTFRDPFVLFSYLSAITTRLGFRTSILILPLFPTAHVAKQAADLALVSQNRFTLGVGISWQEAEYVAFGQDVTRRGRRFEEQIEVLRQFFEKDRISYDGAFHRIDDLGLGQRPSTPVPIWIGSSPAEALLERVVRLADGWLSAGPIPSDEPAETLHRLALEHGRDPKSIGLAGRITAGPGGKSQWLEDAATQVRYGATSIVIGAPQELSIDAAVETVITAHAALSSEL